MAKDYALKFGTGDPRLNTGLTPTFIQFFVLASGATLAPPGITETQVGSGAYYFSYGTTQSIFATADGGAALAAGDRFVSAVLDPIQSVDQKAGYITDSFGSTSVDPSTLFGFAKRMQEWLEGNANYNKSTTLWDVYSRGSSTLLAEKTLTNTTTSATKT